MEVLYFEAFLLRQAAFPVYRGEGKMATGHVQTAVAGVGINGKQPRFVPGASSIDPLDSEPLSFIEPGP